MSSSEIPGADRWEELQISRLLFGLSSEEQAEFDRLAGTVPVEQSQLFEQVVAALDLAWSDPTSMPLPDHLRKAIQSRAREELNKTIIRPAGPTDSLRARTSSLRTLPWIVAAACMMITALTLFTSRQFVLDPSQQRSQLVSTAKDLVQIEWTDTKTDVKGEAGDVVWSPSQQQGFMRFSNLPVNDPTKKQYQLWIFDKNQSELTPIDGGVFDIASNQETVVPIHAKLHVQEVYQFAVTVEKPGGVVVSSREVLPLIAVAD